MEPIFKLEEFFAALEPKDRLTLFVSSCALVISLLSFRQRATETRIALRKQLTDLLEKLTTLNTEFAKFKHKKDDYPSNYGGLLNDQRRFFIRQAASVSRRIKDLVTPYEYLVIAGAFDDVGDTYQAEHFFRLAAKKADAGIERGIALRGHARSLFEQGSRDEARREFSRAIESFQGDSDRLREYRADTYVRWSGHERAWSEAAEAQRLLEYAVREYEGLSNPSKRQERVESVSSLTSIQDGTVRRADRLPDDEVTCTEANSEAMPNPTPAADGKAAAEG